MATSMKRYEESVAPVKRELFQQIRDAAALGPVSILEVGMGTGPNLSFFGSKATAVTALDPNSAMVPYAREAANAAGIPDDGLDFRVGRIEQAPLSDGSFDFVISTLTLCSVESPRDAMSEIRRVLRPGGRFIFVEHVIAPEKSFLRTAQRVLDPLQNLIAGCHLTRDTGQIVEESNFAEVELKRFSVDGLALIAPHVAGTAYAA